MRRPGRIALAAITVGSGVGISQWLGRTSGSTKEERRRRLPGDGLVQDPTFVTNHARTLAASPEAVWPWLTQVGWHRGGWYTPRWVDQLLFPQNWPSADHLEPALLRDLKPGDVIPDGAPGTAHFEVVEVREPHHLVLHSTSHVPKSWQDDLGASIDWCWTFSLAPAPGGGTRMMIRNRARTAPWWLTAAYVGVLIPADHIMATGMLRGLDERTATGGNAS